MKKFKSIIVALNAMNTKKKEIIIDFIDKEKVIYKIKNFKKESLENTLIESFSNIKVDITQNILKISVDDENKKINDKIKLSSTSKMGFVSSFSLEAGTTCPRAKKSQVCKKCYAQKGHYKYPSTKARRIRNLAIIMQDDFVEEMKKALFNDRWFRWFDSGDIASVNIIKKIIQVCQETPWVKHWIPTNSWDIPKLIPYLKILEELPNVTVRYSSRKYNEPLNWHISSMVKTKELIKEELPKRSFECPAPKQNDECGLCRACWNKKIKVIIYKKH